MILRLILSRPKSVDFGTLVDFSRYIASFLFHGWYRNS
jgi:hypothetical protein